MASPGDVIDEEIRVAGNPTDAVRRIIAVIEAAHTHQVVVENPTVYRLIRRYRPGWAAPLLLVKSTESCAVHVTAGPAGGGTLRLVGRLPRTSLAAIQLAVEEPPRYLAPARDPRWRTGEVDWAGPARAPQQQYAAPLAPAPAPAMAMSTPPLSAEPVGMPPVAMPPLVTAPPVAAAPPVTAPPVRSIGPDLTSTMQIPVVPAGVAPMPPAVPLSPPSPSADPARPAAGPNEAGNRTVPRQRAVASVRPTYAVVFDTGEQVRLDEPLIVGRAPARQPGEPGRLLPINDPDFSISKTHLAVGADSDGPWVMDRHSLNGTAIVRSEGEIACPPGERVQVALGDTVYFGNRRFMLRSLPADVG